MNRTPLFAWLVAAAFTVLLNETTVGVALPSIMRAFQVSATAAQWLVSAYLLTLGCVLPLTGSLVQRLGTTRTLGVSALIFLAGSVLALASTELWMLVLARVVQGAGGAPLIPLLTTTAMRDSRPEHRGRALGIVSLAIGIAPASGPVVAGLLLSLGDWRWLFAPSVLLCSAVLIRTLLAWRGGGDDRTNLLGGIDAPSACFAALAVGGFIVAADGTLGRGIPLWACVCLGAVATTTGWAFLRRQRSLTAAGRPPVLDLRVFGSPGLRRGAASLATGMAGLFGVFTLLPIVAGTTLGIDPLTAGLLMLPGGLLMGLLGPIVGRMADRVPSARLTVPGLALMAVAATAFGVLRPGQWGLLLALHLVLSAGFGLMITPLYLDALGERPAELVPHASAMMGTIQQVTAALGTVVVVAVAALGESSGFLAAGLLLASAVVFQVAPGLSRR